MQPDHKMKDVMRKLWLSGLLTLALCSPSHATDGDDAIAVVERLHQALLEVALAEPSLTLEQRLLALSSVVAETHDFTNIARFTVRRHWRGWSDAQQLAFVAAFERFSVTTYASRFSAIGRQSFEIVGSEPAARERIEVNAVINRSEADDITLNYLLRFDGEAWRIVNISHDRVSDLALKQSEYQAILESGTVENLIEELEAQTAAL